jgi:thiol-disulfide isomerase/thioredoxin
MALMKRGKANMINGGYNLGRAFGVFVLTLLAFVLIAPSACRVGGEEPQSMYEGKVNAPEFPAGLEWLNTERPLSLKGLRGKVVLLDFWTYCCINCMHIIPDLKRLEEKYAEELVVIGVHSAKFSTEKETDNIRQAILRYEIEHPVVNDRDFRVWNAYGVRAWPTLVLIDPAGKVVGVRSGEGIFEPFDMAIAEVVRTFEAGGELDRTPLDLTLEREKAPATLLRFPGKVLADDESGRLFISDSNHNRIVVVSLEDYSVQEVIGSGEAGLKDGEYGEAAFNHPQGLALRGDSLYVADTENHAVRAVELAEKRVDTIAGTGVQGWFGGQGGPGLRTQLNSPWDLVAQDGSLFIAMAGSHQIWRLDLATGRVEPHSGSGREDRVDGPLKQAALAQPSGISSNGRKLFFADSEVSSIRSADIDPGGRVETIVGEALFEFGDVDGQGGAVRLQHPLGLICHEGLLYVADTYNNKIKIVDPVGKSSHTFLGSGREGMADGRGDEATFDEPGGLSIAGDKLYIADTNNHLIRVADLLNGDVRTLKLKGMERLTTGASSASDTTPVRLGDKSARAGEVTLTVTLDLPLGFKLTEGAPTAISVTLDGGEPNTMNVADFPVSLLLELSEGEHEVVVDYSVYFCRDGAEGLCYFRDGMVLLPVKGGAGFPDSNLMIELQISVGF